LNAALSRETDWIALPAPAMTLLTFRHRDLAAYVASDISFLAQASARSDDLYRHRQLRLDDL
jgi:hypothetical protein